MDEEMNDNQTNNTNVNVEDKKTLSIEFLAKNIKVRSDFVLKIKIN